MVVGGSDNKPHNAACIQSTRGPEPQDCQASLIVPLVPRTTRLQPCLLRSMLWLGASHYISFAAHGWEMWCLRYTRRNERKTFSWNPFMHHWKCSKHSYVCICLEVRGQSLHRASHWPGANIGVGEAGQPLNHLYPQCWDYSTYHYVHFFFHTSSEVSTQILVLAQATVYCPGHPPSHYPSFLFFWWMGVVRSAFFDKKDGLAEDRF